MYKIKDLPVEERPRERLKEVGVSNLTDKEIISIILKTGTKEKNVNDLSLELLSKYKLNDLMKLIGIGEVKSIELITSIELGKRIFLREANKLTKLDSSTKIYEDSKYLFNGLKQECFYCYYFNTKQELIKRKLIFKGTVNSSTTHTREVFKEAYLLSASFIVCLHNHPTGDITPSYADIEFTKALMKTGEIQKIPVLDHIIVGDNNYFSFYENMDILNI